MNLNLGIILGSYRSLCTLTAALFELNKNCLVLNHGRKRAFKN